MDNEIRSLIREVLAEELQARKDTVTQPEQTIREEIITIDSDESLNRFATRMIELADDKNFLEKFRQDGIRFRLAGTKKAESATEFNDPLVSERQIAALPDGVTIGAGKRVRFTPLAMDEIRRKRIRLERKKQ